MELTNSGLLYVPLRMFIFIFILDVYLVKMICIALFVLLTVLCSFSYLSNGCFPFCFSFGAVTLVLSYEVILAQWPQ